MAAAAAVRPSEAQKVRASENTTQRFDLIKDFAHVEGWAQNERVIGGPQRKHELSHNSGNNISRKPHIYISLIGTF